MPPKTLLDLGWREPNSGPPRQRDRCGDRCRSGNTLDGLLPLAGVEPALDEIGRLLARARAANVPVIDIIHQGREGVPFAPGSGARDRVPGRSGPARPW